MDGSFRAFVVRAEGDELVPRFENLHLEDLPAGEITIAVHVSSVNYKDALVTKPGSRVVRDYPMVPGIDLAGASCGNNWLRRSSQSSSKRWLTMCHLPSLMRHLGAS